MSVGQVELGPRETSPARLILNRISLLSTPSHPITPLSPSLMLSHPLIFSTLSLSLSLAHTLAYPCRALTLPHPFTLALGHTWPYPRPTFAVCGCEKLRICKLVCWGGGAQYRGPTHTCHQTTVVTQSIMVLPGAAVVSYVWVQASRKQAEGCRLNSTLLGEGGLPTGYILKAPWHVVLQGLQGRGLS